MDQHQRDRMIDEAVNEVKHSRIIAAAAEGIDLDEPIFLANDNGIRQEVIAALAVFERYLTSRHKNGCPQQ